MTTRKYEASGVQAEFEPGSRDRVLRNLLGIVRVRNMEHAESEQLERVQREAVARYGRTHRFRTSDIRELHRELHRSWLGPNLQLGPVSTERGHRQRRISICPCGPHSASHGGVREATSAASYAVQ